MAAALVLLVIGIGYGLYAFLSKPKAPTVPFQRPNITKLTTTGKVEDAVISPDGKYVAYVESTRGQHSLWVKHVPTGDTVQIIPPAGESNFYFGLTFSNDSNHIFFVRSDGVEKWKLFKVSVLGVAPPRKLLEHIDSAVTFSGCVASAFPLIDDVVQSTIFSSRTFKPTSFKTRIAPL